MTIAAEIALAMDAFMEERIQASKPLDTDEGAMAMVAEMQRQFPKATKFDLAWAMLIYGYRNATSDELAAHDQFTQEEILPTALAIRAKERRHLSVVDPDVRH
jgi:hypothetical protein